MFGLGLRKIPFGGLVLTLHKFNPEDNFGFKVCIGVILVSKKIWFLLGRNPTRGVFFVGYYHRITHIEYPASTEDIYRFFFKPANELVHPE